MKETLPKKLTPVDFCIMVMWVHGWTVGEIHKYFAKQRGKTQGMIRGTINRIRTRRADMDRPARQRYLDMMKEARIDDGKLEDHFFTAKSLATDITAGQPKPEPKKQDIKKEPEFDLSSKTGRRMQKKYLKQQAALKRKATDRETAERETRSAGGAPRGADVYPLEYLSNARLLSDDVAQAKGRIDKDANESSRKTSGERLRARFEMSLLSGVKSQSWETMGTSSGKGFSMTHTVMQANRELESLRQMMGSELYVFMERMLRFEERVWAVTSDVEPALERVRCALDIVTMFDGYLTAEDFENRWGYLPPKPEMSWDREGSVDTVRTAREIIERAQRVVK